MGSRATAINEVFAAGARMAFVIAAVLIGAGHARAEAPLPEGTPRVCFEVISPHAGVRSTLLLDKCSGRTWQLVPSHRVGGVGTLVYRWRPIVRFDGGTAARRPSTVAARRPAAAPSTGTRCFTFDGRRFCE